MAWFQKPSENNETSVMRPVNVNVPPLPAGYATCDRCGPNVLAWFRVAVVDAVYALWLDFCRHCFREHELEFRVRGYAVDDQSKHCNEVK